MKDGLIELVRDADKPRATACDAEEEERAVVADVDTAAFASWVDLFERAEVLRVGVGELPPEAHSADLQDIATLQYLHLPPVTCAVVVDRYYARLVGLAEVRYPRGEGGEVSHSREVRCDRPRVILRPDDRAEDKPASDLCTSLLYRRV